MHGKERAIIMFRELPDNLIKTSLEERAFLEQQRLDLHSYLLKPTAEVTPVIFTSLGRTLQNFVVNGMIAKSKWIKMFDSEEFTTDDAYKPALLSELNLVGAIYNPLSTAHLSVPTLYRLSDNDLISDFHVPTQQLPFLKERLYAYVDQSAQWISENKIYIAEYQAGLEDSRVMKRVHI